MIIRVVGRKQQASTSMAAMVIISSAISQKSGTRNVKSMGRKTVTGGVTILGGTVILWATAISLTASMIKPVCVWA